MKKVLSLFLSVVMLLSITAGIDFSVSAATQNAMWFMSDLKITQVPGGDYSHKGTQNFDVVGVKNNNIFAPFDCKVVKIYSGTTYGNTVVIESTAKVNYADGTCDYMTMCFAHDNDISDLSVDKKISQGQVFYQTGTYGNVTGRHSHVTVIRGKYKNDMWTKNSYGNYCSPNAISPTKALFIADNTNVVDSKGLSFKKVSVNVTKPSVTVKAVSNVTSSSAQINFTANNPSKVTIKTVGVQVRKKGDSAWTTKSEAMNSNYVNAASTPMWWTVGKGKEVNITLSAGTTYEYRAYVVYNGTNYYSSISTFTTTGHSHNYSSWKVTKSPTCEDYGVKTYYCSCGATKTESIAPNGHSYKTMPADTPTCTEWGMTEYKYCSVCGEYYNYPYYIEPTGHIYKNVVTKATLTKNGKIVKKCSNCGEVAKTTKVYYPKTIKLNKNIFTTNGKVQKPTVTVKDVNGKALTLNKDYTVSYSNTNSKNVGKYTVTVKFKGNYSGTKTFSYYINPKPTEFVPSNKGGFKAVSKGFTLKWNKQSSQTTGYQIQYATKKDFSNAATITIANPNTTSKTIKGRAGNTRYYVRVRTYKKIGNGTFYSNWNSGTKSVVTLK